MIYPKFLKQGSKIAIVSPAGTINKDFILSAKNYLSANGFEVITYPSVFNKHFQFAGTDEERLRDLQSALDNECIDAILCSRGGYGLIRILDKLNFTKFIKKPKWIVGFSDITNLHLAVNRLGIASIHGQMTKAFHENPKSESIYMLINAICGKSLEYKIHAHNLNTNGETVSELIGGNLSIIYSLQGTKFEVDTNGKILFIEDLNEYLYNLDRIMCNLKISGKLKNLKGLIVGSFTDMLDNKSPFGKNAYEIIHEHVSEYCYPVCFNFPAGHIPDNMPLFMGINYKLNVNNNNVLLNSII